MCDVWLPPPSIRPGFLLSGFALPPLPSSSSGPTTAAVVATAALMTSAAGGGAAAARSLGGAAVSTLELPSAVSTSGPPAAVVDHNVDVQAVQALYQVGLKCGR